MAGFWAKKYLAMGIGRAVVAMRQELQRVRIKGEWQRRSSHNDCGKPQCRRVAAPNSDWLERRLLHVSYLTLASVSTGGFFFGNRTPGVKYGVEHHVERLPVELLLSPPAIPHQNTTSRNVDSPIDRGRRDG